MLIARPLSAVGGVLVLIVLSRQLTPIDYGVYFAIWAIVEILILSSNVGLLHAAYRYVSAGEWSDGRIHLQGPIWQLIFWRLISLLIFSTMLFALPPISAYFFNGGSVAKNSLHLIALIILAEGIARYLEALFDSMLFQGSSHITLLSRTLLKFIAFSYFAFSDSLSLEKAIYVELAAALIGAAIGFLLLWNLYRNAAKNPDKPEAQKIDIRRMARFALPAYAAQILGITYGPDALKLALGAVAGAPAIALFGFAFSIASVVQRYMPANILSGIFRPLFVAVSKAEYAENRLSELLNISIKINCAFLLSAVCFLYFGGESLLLKISENNYPGAGLVTALIVLGLLAVAVHLNLSMYCIAKENSWPPLLATATSTVGLPLGYFFAKQYGAVGIAVAFGVTELIWSAVCLVALQVGLRQNLELHWAGFGKLLGAAIVSVVICMLFRVYFSPMWLIPALLAPGLFLGLVSFLEVFSNREKTWLISVLPLNRLSFLVRSR